MHINMFTEKQEPTIAGNQLSKEYWMTDEEVVEFRDAVEKFQRHCDTYKNDEAMKRFAEKKVVELVYNSNKLENTMPNGTTEDDIANLLQHKDTLTVEEWNADGKGLLSRTQMVNHKKAYEFLISQQNLTMKVIQETHHILMDGAMSDNGRPILNGKLRTFNVNNGVDNYMPHAEVEVEFSKLIATYKYYSSDPIMEASNLFWKFLQIHPFEDGNGRVARLLVAFCLFQSGTPFPVIITSGKRRSYKHYINTIKRQQYVCTKSNPLYTLIAYSVHLGWKEYLSSIPRGSASRKTLGFKAIVTKIKNYLMDLFKIRPFGWLQLQ